APGPSRAAPAPRQRVLCGAAVDGGVEAGPSPTRPDREISAAPRQAEDALGDDVALHLRRPRGDRAAPRVEEEVRPASVVDGVRRALQQDAVLAEQADRGLELALVHLAPEELLDRALGPR